MPDQLSDLLVRSFDAVNLLQGLIISFVAAITMSRYAQIFYFSIIAIVVDQFFTLAFRGQADDSVKGISTVVWQKILELDATVVILHFIFYLVVITIMYSLKQLFRRT